MSDPSHPIWSLGRMMIVMTALTLILYLNATKFDKTEIITIIGMFTVLSGAEGTSIAQYLKNHKKPADPSDH